eukprot:9415388-Lingulodinium_polyedra.AAC.1
MGCESICPDQKIAFAQPNHSGGPEPPRHPHGLEPSSHRGWFCFKMVLLGGWCSTLPGMPASPSAPRTSP